MEALDPFDLTGFEALVDRQFFAELPRPSEDFQDAVFSRLPEKPVQTPQQEIGIKGARALGTELISALHDFFGNINHVEPNLHTPPLGSRRLSNLWRRTAPIRSRRWRARIHHSGNCRRQFPPDPRRYSSALKAGKLGAPLSCRMALRGHRRASKSFGSDADFGGIETRRRDIWHDRLSASTEVPHGKLTSAKLAMLNACRHRRPFAWQGSQIAMHVAIHASGAYS